MQIAVRVATVGKECNSHEALWTKSRKQDADDVKVWIFKAPGVSNVNERMAL